MFITTETELKDYIFRKLGSEQHRVELSDNNFQDCLNASLKYTMEYSNDGIEEKYILSTLDTSISKEVILQDKILAVLDIIAPSSFSDTNVFYPGRSPVYDFLKMSNLDTSSYLLYSEQMKDIRNIFRKRLNYTYNSQTKKLIVNESFSNQVILKIVEKVDEALLYDNTLFLKVLEKNCWEQWENNLSKYQGSSIGNGVTINTEWMKEKYTKLEEDIEKSLEDDEYNFLGPVKI